MESVTLDQEWDEDKQAEFTFHGMRDPATGRWTLLYADLETITAHIGGARVVLRGPGLLVLRRADGHDRAVRLDRDRVRGVRVGTPPGDGPPAVAVERRVELPGGGEPV